MINIPIAQSVRFRPLNQTVPNFDNTFAVDNGSVKYYFENVLPAQDIQIQVVSDVTRLPIAYLFIIHNGTRTAITTQTLIEQELYKYDTFTISLANYIGQCCYFECEFLYTLNGTPVIEYRSEEFTVGTIENGLTVEWSNSENAFQMDYSDGLTHIMQIDAKLWKLTYGGESTVYVNQGREVKLKGIVKRTFLLECELPDYMAEILTIAMEHDHFYINEVEFVVSKKPSLSQMGHSAMYNFSAEVTQKNVIGLNSHGHL